ncbi:hypothetical protein LSM04_008162 [Trypanosoma melophagium]|uniref:uncharacterized protein n=1 Tax=Trypanosoma melophagium TaxID=715481 RepID=UPI00351A9001|nr:hypothetical protein LSM04_008162 [Trypanosoma melophagium]
MDGAEVSFFCGEAPLTMELILQIAAEWSSAEAARLDVMHYISSLPAWTDDMFSPIGTIQTDRLRKMSETAVLLEIFFKQMILSSDPRSGRDLERKHESYEELYGGYSDDVCIDHENDLCGKTKYYLSPVPKILELCDAMDECLVECQSTQRQVQHQKKGVCEAVKVLGLK